MGKFKISKITELQHANVGQEFEESDFSCILENGNFVQMTYHEEDENALATYEVKPGIWKIIKTNMGMKLIHSEFSKEEILESFVNTKELETKIDCFFKKVQSGVYTKLKVEVPKRAALLWGPPGTGKTQASIHVANKYVNEYKDTAVVLWNTDTLDPFDVKTFVQQFEYKGVSKLILIAEDLGGVEMDQVRMKSTAALLSLLDNKEKTFKIPVFIIATTNFPQNFLGNLTNRPQRFDDKIHIDNPTGSQRKELFMFFLRNFMEDYSAESIESASKLLGNSKYKDFSIAHLQEIIIRSQIYDKTLVESINSIQEEVELFQKEFETNKGKLGIGTFNEYD